MLPMAVCEHALQIDRLTWIQRGPFLDLLFQNTVLAGMSNAAADVPSNAFKEINAQRQTRRCREAGTEHE